ncbi:translation elongation factor Ts [Tuwongella immobilis]|uniref:Elongation factor Ts n=1 Tax=Tuwongella immobilis TaxID=692036 RepID=A0A6C2YQI2_9BACT|nr:translation elongation factor Ts [Tuwongella immobilis]VIP03654.1 elongation factor ts : Elongation factor Ts OS=Rhodopirellula maiorica SM1 GN=tsf PE=3 SV=1: UBA: EF_TS [Tuwongella immobilis]VTS04676.1 elongation factor ts : Elongation factor Ts OS=Rhodopirellula maiorica SM1 GN=tsf PE=3 SV=1: UBA: EF_TS [Tuwongella immobilis]
MAEITATAVQTLRQRTSLPLMDCKRALVEAEGDMEKAVEILRIRNKGVVDKRIDNETSEGRVAVFIDPATKVAGIIELLCETAPVAKSDQFIALANEMAKSIALHNPQTVDELLAQASEVAGETINDRLTAVVGLIREKMKPGRFTRLVGGSFGSYIHHDGSLGVLVQVLQEGGDATTLKDVAMHVAAVVPTPVSARRDEVPEAIVAKEMEIARAKAAATGKPAQVAEKIAEGQMKTWFAENVLVEQPFIKDPSKTVGQILESAKLEIQKFVRVKVGASA